RESVNRVPKLQDCRDSRPYPVKRFLPVQTAVAVVGCGQTKSAQRCRGSFTDLGAGTRICNNTGHNRVPVLQTCLATQDEFRCHVKELRRNNNKRKLITIDGFAVEMQ